MADSRLGYKQLLSGFGEAQMTGRSVEDAKSIKRRKAF